IVLAVSLCAALLVKLELLLHGSAVLVARRLQAASQGTALVLAATAGSGQTGLDASNHELAATSVLAAHAFTLLSEAPSEGTASSALTTIQGAGAITRLAAELAQASAICLQSLDASLQQALLCANLRLQNVAASLLAVLLELNPVVSETA